VLARLVSLHYPKMRTKASTGDFSRYFHCVAVGMAFLINVGYTQPHLEINLLPVFQLLHHVSSIYNPCTIPSDTSVYNDEVLTLVAKFIIIPVAVFIELFSVYTVKNNYSMSEVCRLQMFFLDTQSTTFSSHICTVEYSDHLITTLA